MLALTGLTLGLDTHFTGWSSNILDMKMLQDSNAMAVLCPVYSHIATFQNLSLKKLLLSVEFKNCHIRENMKIQYALISLSLYLVGNLKQKQNGRYRIAVNV